MTLPSADHLALLYRISQTFNSSLDLNEVLNQVMDEVIAVTRAERGFLVLREADGRLMFHAARGVNQQAIESPQFQISRGVVERVANDGQPILNADAQSDAQLAGRQSVMMLGLRSILCVPLQLKGKILGVIYVDSRLKVGIFGTNDLELLTAIAASAAVAIENARLYLLAVDKGKLERELQLAREVQASLLPRATPNVPGWEFAAAWQPAREVAGDYYDFILDIETGLGLVIADVTDKGMAAALFMAITRSTVRASAARAASPADCITRANHLISADSTDAMFVTLFYAHLDPASGTVAYVNAGHNPPFLYRAASDELIRLERTGMALGVDGDNNYDQREVTLAPGDFIFMYTDGVPDAINAREEVFGEEALERLVREHRHGSSADLVAALEAALRAHTGAGDPYDDVTMMAVKCLSVEKESGQPKPGRQRK
ncbi:MAG: GAF domain-containing SpoIIE family protein phosphatase [Chloroflexota bacterium]